MKQWGSGCPPREMVPVTTWRFFSDEHPVAPAAIRAATTLNQTMRLFKGSSRTEQKCLRWGRGGCRDPLPGCVAQARWAAAALPVGPHNPPVVREHDREPRRAADRGGH